MVGMAFAALIIAVILGALAVLRLVAVSREVSRNNARIRMRDDDLATWIADYDVALIADLRKMFSDMAGRGRLHGRGIVDAGETAKEEALDRYAEQLRDSQRTLHAVAASERTIHSVVRALTGRPVPSLNAPVAMRRTIERWEEPATAEKVRAA
jgi:hypothetical protein